MTFLSKGSVKIFHLIRGLDHGMMGCFYLHNLMENLYKS